MFKLIQCITCKLIIILKKYTIYLIKNLFYSFCLTVFIITTIIWVTRSVKYIKYITEYGLDIHIFLQVILLILPPLLLIILPISIIITNILIYNKLIKNNELIILQNSGVSKKSILFSALLLSLACSIYIFYLTFFLIPQTEFKLAHIQKNMKNNIVNVLLNNDNFNRLNNITLYVKEKNEDILNSLLIYIENQKENKIQIIYAKKGIVKDNVVKLIDGNIQEFVYNDHDTQTTMFFDEYAVDLFKYYNLNNNDFKEKKISFTALNIIDLLAYPNKNSKEYLYELHQRLINSLICLAVGVLSAFLIINAGFSRMNNNKDLFKTFVINISIFLIVLYTLKLAKNNINIIYISYSFIFIPILYVYFNLREKKYV